MYWLPYAFLVLLTTLALCSANEEEFSEESDDESTTTEIPLSSIFSVGKKLCKPRFSEISTLYLGVDAQDNRNEFDEFLELDFPPRECQNVRNLVISKYTVLVLDTRPTSAALVGSQFYGKLHQSKMRTNSRHFVIGNRSEASRCRRPFDIAFTHSKGNALVNCISKVAFEIEDFQSRRVLEQNLALRIAHVADYPVVFVLVENPPASAREDFLRMKELAKDASYAKTVGGRRIRLEEGVKYLQRRDHWRIMFEYAVDVVVVNRNTRVTKHTEFIQRMFTAFGRYGIQPSMVAIDMDANTRDLPRGRSISLCIPEPEDLSYTRTHTSTYWKFSRHTPGEDNDCSAPSYLRVFDDHALYTPILAEYLYPELGGQRREEEEEGALERSIEHQEEDLDRSEERQDEEEGDLDRSIEHQEEDLDRSEERQDEEEGDLERSIEHQEEEMDVGDDGGEAEEASTAAGSRQIAVPRRSERLRERGRGTVPPGEAARGVVEPRETAFSFPQFSVFSYEEKNEVMTKLSFLYEQAKIMQSLQRTDAKSRAREAMLDYESKKRCNFMTHDLDMLLNTGHFPNPREYRTKRLLEQLTAEKYKYFKPLFPNEWANGKRVLRVRCEPCYEYFKSTSAGSAAAPYPMATEKGADFTDSVIKMMANHLRGQTTTHATAVEAYKERTLAIVNSYLEAVDQAPTDPGAAGSRLFMLAYSAAKMYLPPYQFPTLCAAVSAMGTDIGNMQHTRDGFVKMTDYISKSMKAKLIQYIKTNQSPFSLLIDSSTDPGSKQVLLVFIRFPDRHSMHPTTHFLEALEMTESETGRNIFEKIYEYFKREDLLHELTWNLVAVATDGAANMNAPGRGLRGILNANVSRTRKDDLLSRGDTQDAIDAVPSSPVIWIHCMAHKIELALTDAFAGRVATRDDAEEEEEEVEYDVGEGDDGDAESDRIRTRRFAVWRKFATSYLNKLRVFFSAPSRLRVLREAHNIVEDENFVKLKGIIEIRWTSSEENAIYSFMRMYKHVWIALQQISLSVERSNQERMKAASFLRVVKSLKFYRYMVFQLQILGQISVLSKEAQSEATLLWKADRDLDVMLRSLNDMAERPNHYEKTKPFLQEVLCKPVTDRGHFRRNALDSLDCERWFWNGWQYERSVLRQEIQYKMRHDTLDLMFNREAGGLEIDEEQALLDNIAGELNAERDNLIHWLRNPQIFHDFNEEVTRRSISELKISDDFRRASFTNMDHAKRTLLVTNVGGALRSRLEYEHNSVLYAISAFSLKSLRNYNADEKTTRDIVSSFFGYPSLEEDVQQLSRQLSRLPAEQRRQFDKAEKKMQYFLPVLRSFIRSGPVRISYRQSLLNLLAKIVSIPVSTAEVERGFSVYTVIREPRRSRTTIRHMSNYLRIAISGPDKLSPYEFLQYPTNWFKDTRHRPADFPVPTRGPGKKTQERLQEEEEFLSIFDPNRFYTQFYFSLSDQEPPPITVLEDRHIEIIDLEEF